MSEQEATDNRVQFRADTDMQTWLQDRNARLARPAHLSMGAQSELRLWRQVLTLELRHTGWTVNELCVLADLSNAAVFDAMLTAHLAADLKDAIEYYPGLYGERWDVDEMRLLAKVRTLGPVADHATREAMAQFWGQHHELDVHDPTTWQELGFRLIADPTASREGK